MGALVDFQAVKQDADVMSVLSQLGITRTKFRSGEVKSDCPLCGGTNWCFSVNLEKKVWQCFRCKDAGDIIKLVATKEKVGVREAAERISSPQPASHSSAEVPQAKGFMRDLERTLDVILELKPGEDAVTWKSRVKKEFKKLVYDSYANGKKASR